MIGYIYETGEFIEQPQNCDWYVLGDINQDTEINIVAIVLIVQFIMEVPPTDQQFILSDYNEDGDVNVVDIVVVVNSILSSRSAQTDATEATISLDNNSISIEADGYIGGVDMVVEFEGNLVLDIPSEYVGDYVINNFDFYFKVNVK